MYYGTNTYIDNYTFQNSTLNPEVSLDDYVGSACYTFSLLQFYLKVTVAMTTHGIRYKVCKMIIKIHIHSDKILI